MEPSAATLVGAGIATVGMAGAGVGLGILFGSYLQAAIRNPAGAAAERIWLFVGMGLTESMGIFALVISFMLLFHKYRLVDQTPTSPASGATAGTEQQSGGLPQFDFAQWPGQILWFLIIFGVVLFLMRVVFIPRIGGTIDGRDEKISGDIAEARRLKAEADLQAKEAAAELAMARAVAQRTAVEARAKAQAEVTARLAEEESKLALAASTAEARIVAARDKAMGNVRSIALETAQAIVARLTGVTVTAKEVETAAARQAQG